MIGRNLRVKFSLESHSSEIAVGIFLFDIHLILYFLFFIFVITHSLDCSSSKIAINYGMEISLNIRVTVS